MKNYVIACHSISERNAAKKTLIFLIIRNDSLLQRKVCSDLTHTDTYTRALGGAVSETT